MNPGPACFAAALCAGPAAVGASGTPAPRNSGPAPVNYRCSDGHNASVVYESGSDFQHAKATVTYEGRTIEMRAAPTLYGVRYRAEAAQDGAPLAWSLRGEEGWLTESPDADSYTRQEQAIARCIRLRGAAPVETASADSHGEDHQGHGEDH